MRWIEINEDVWHGSPHTVDRFSTDNIGSGEGSAVYGWGLYFTGTREVAEHYRKLLMWKFTYKGRPVKPRTPLHTAIYYLAYCDGDKAAAKDYFTSPNNEKEYALIDQIDYSEVGQKGHVYDVHIPDNSEFLLWDEHLRDQSPHVQRVLKSLVTVPKVVLRNFTRRMNGPSRLDGWDEWMEWAAHLHDEHRELNGETLYLRLANQLHNSRKAASLALLAAGVHGIRYLDGDSRDMGKGGYNYVIFDGALVTIKQPPLG